MKLEVGMYVRITTLSGIGKIAKIEKIDDICITDNGAVDKNNIIKASHNIIDLIEVGDYVNGYKVYYCYCADEDMTGLFIDTETKRVWLDKPSQIKTIVTKQQFSSMEYRLGE